MAALLKEEPKPRNEDDGEPTMLRTEVCIFLRSFCYSNDAIPSQDFKDLGILKSLIKICESEHEDLQAKENAIAALANFASCSEENKVILRDEGGLRPLLYFLKILDASDDTQANMKMGTIIAISHMSSQVDLSVGDLKEIELYWTTRRDLADVMFSPNDVKFVLHTKEPAIKMMALWCIAYIALEEPPVGSTLTWKTVAATLAPFIVELRTRSRALDARQKEIVVTALEKLAAFGAETTF